ncbi:CmpA/NrtA family ABC transporter substrate-binding protein [Methylocystis sp. IM3]|uniref:CmpA/NrtA family ABC transporter substrate-binding protein n=1 Tax=unclassified Methylocystis TaxID=2625913 RepID=UPI0030F5CB9C
MTSLRPVRIGFMPLVDAAIVFVAVDKGFAAAEGLDVTLVREVSWSNIRDRLAIGHYDAAHLLSPMSIAATLGLRQVKVRLIATLNLATNGNAITVSPSLNARLLGAADGDIADPLISARALRAVVSEDEKRGAEPLTFAMTFPFSVHNYQLRYWMAQGGIDPDKDLRLVVLPPPFMAENLANGQIDGFCVGAPWNAVAAETAKGVVLHPGCAIFNPAPEKTLAIRESTADRDPWLVSALIRACLKAADFVAAPDNRAEVAAILARSDRVGIDAKTLHHILDGRWCATASTANKDYLIFGDRISGRPDPYQAAWLFAQMARWGQARTSAEAQRIAEGVFNPAFFDREIGPNPGVPPAHISAFAGPAFDADAMETYIGAFPIAAKDPVVR